MADSVFPSVTAKSKRDDIEDAGQHQPAAPAWRPAAVYRGMVYQTTCVPDHEQQRAKLEALRYKWRYQKARGIMQWMRDKAERGSLRWWLLGLYLGWALRRAWH